jgi:hypothetical protein
MKEGRGRKSNHFASVDLGRWEAYGNIKFAPLPGKTIVELTM